jgi:hypothetical protein
VKLNAAEAILSRGWGKPIQAFQVDGRFLTKKLSELNESELLELEQRMALLEPEQGNLLTFSNDDGAGK